MPRMVRSRGRSTACPARSVRPCAPAGAFVCVAVCCFAMFVALVVVAVFADVVAYFELTARGLRRWRYWVLRALTLREAVLPPPVRRARTFCLAALRRRPRPN